MKGKLFLLPAPISSNQSMKDILLTQYIDTVSSLEYIVSETPKIARSYLTTLPLKKKIQDIDISELSEHTQDIELEKLLEPIQSGYDVGLISDAGLPSIADPGYRLVSIAQKKNISIVPLTGPSSIFLALMASGLNGQSFSFWGYLPKEKGLKRKKIKTLERIAISTNQTQIFMEAPYKNQSMLEDILDVCEGNSRLCIAMDIMGETQFIRTRKIEEWNKDLPVLEKKPCLFLINT
jgi:16S rRNA (cytidine1402-2'-O)-methyltransferase